MLIFFVMLSDALDTCGFVPRVVGDSAELPADAVDHYTFISSLSVYSDLSMVGLDENGPIATMEDETVEEITGETYGPLKVLCEQVVTEVMSGGTKEERSLHVRAGLIVGPHDLSDRFTYWPYRLGRGGDIPAPGKPEAPVQFIDVRDLAEWTVTATEARVIGPCNVTGPDYSLTMEQVLASCRDVTGSEAKITWVSDEFLLENDVAAYTEAPLWVPAENAGFSTVNCHRAIETGLKFRPLRQTVSDTFVWQATRPEEYEWRSGLKAEREAALLHAWRER